MRYLKRQLQETLARAGVDDAVAHFNRGKVKTLIYHNVLPETAAFPYALTPAEFERHLVLIKEKYNPVHLDERGAIVGLASNKINVLITFDDGFINNYEYVFPILTKQELKATFFLIVDCVETGAIPGLATRYARIRGRLDEQYRTVSLAQILEMMAAGMMFGSHTFAHTDFTQIEWAEGLSIARNSAERLSDMLRHEVKLFAFPWGRYRPGQPEALAGSFNRIFTTKHGFNQAGDTVMRRDEAVSEAHLRLVASGARDLGRKVIASGWPGIPGLGPPLEATGFCGDCDGRLDRTYAGHSDNDESNPLIAFVLPSLGLGGAEIVAATLGKEFLKRGFRTDFVVGWDEEESLAVLPPRAGYVRLSVKQPWKMLLPLARYLRERRPQAVVASLWPLTVATIAAGKLAGSRARIAVWNHSAASIQSRRLASPKRILFKKSISLLYPFADARIAVSAGVADDLAALCALRREDIEVVYNPFLERPVDPVDRVAEAVWGGWTGPRILTVGNTRPEKNHALLIRAFKKLLARQDARLLILGGDPGGRAGGVDELKAYARSLGIADKVIVPGRVLNPTAYYLSANLFVLSSDAEGFGNVIVEALASGLPVVSTDCPYGPAEILADGRYGWLTPVGDEDALARAIHQALDSTHDPDMLKRRADDFSAEKVADRYLRILFPRDCERPHAMTSSKNRSCAV